MVGWLQTLDQKILLSFIVDALCEVQELLMEEAHLARRDAVLLKDVVFGLSLFDLFQFGVNPVITRRWE